MQFGKEKTDAYTNRIREMLCDAYNYLYRTGKRSKYWDDVRSTALAGIALSYKENPDSNWMAITRNYLRRTQTQDGENAGSWNSEVWDTAMSMLALKRMGITSKDKTITNAVNWLVQGYNMNTRYNWNDEPWETSWGTIAILTARTIPPAIDVNKTIDWLLGFQDDDGRIVSSHYTCYYLMIYNLYRKYTGFEKDEPRYTAAKDKALSFLVNQLKDSDPAVLWSGEGWANGQILWAICDMDCSVLEDEALVEKILKWFEDTQDNAEGVWSDVEDTASAIIGLIKLLDCIFRNNNYNESIGTMLAAIPSETVYINKNVFEKDDITGGYAIHIGGDAIRGLKKFIYIIRNTCQRDGAYHIHLMAGQMFTLKRPQKWRL